MLWLIVHEHLKGFLHGNSFSSWQNIDPAILSAPVPV